MHSRQILDAHPSVQDLTVTQDRVNLNKVQAHRYAINAGPLTSSATFGVSQAAWEKGQKVIAVRNEAAITEGKRRPRTPLVSQLQQDVMMGRAAASLFTATDPVAAKAAAAGAKGGRDSKAGLPPLPPAAKTGAPTTGGAEVDDGRPTMAAAPATDARRPSSTVSSVVSFDANASHASSYSVYSCSCCGVKPPSSVFTSSSAAAPLGKKMAVSSEVGGATRQVSSASRGGGKGPGSDRVSQLTVDEDNFTSVSQRRPTGGRRSAASSSVNSAVVRQLERLVEVEGVES